MKSQRVGYMGVTLVGERLDQWASWLLLDDVARQRAASKFIKLPAPSNWKPKLPFMASRAQIVDRVINEKISRKCAEALIVYHLMHASFGAKAQHLQVAPSTMHERLVIAHWDFVAAIQGDAQ